MASLIGRQLGGYLIEQEIGRGAMGVVFKARQLSMDRYVALKFLPKRLAQDDKIVARFLREARAAGQLSHPNLVNVHDAGVVDGLHFIAMEFVDGSSVHNVVRNNGPYGEKETLGIALQVASALKAAHAKGILHRDVKPDNFLIDSSGRVRLADLGLAHFQNSEEDNEVTNRGTTVGTPHYMSPEQCSGRALDERSDIYSLGASMYVLATGQTPFEGPCGAAVMVKALTESPRSLKQLNPKLSPSFVALVEKMLHKDPSQRFQSAHEAMDAIERCQKGQYKPVTKAHAKVDDVPLIPLEQAPRYKLLLYGAAAAVLALAAAELIVRGRGQGAPLAARPSASLGANSAGKQQDPASATAASAAQAEPRAVATDSPSPAAKAAANEPPHLPSALTESTVMDERQMAAVKKLSRLKQELAEQVLQDPDAAIARMQDFLNQHPGPRVANIAQDFLAKAKEAKAKKEKLDKDWAEAKGTAEEEALAGHKAKAFHVLRKFVDAHAGTKPASTALGMMLGWVTDLRSEAGKAAAAGNYGRAVEMLALANSKLPDEITGPLQKDLERYTAEQDKSEAAAAREREEATAKTKPTDQPKAAPPEKPEKKDETAAKKEEKTDEAVSAELRKLGWTEVTGNWTQDPKRKTVFSVSGGGALTAPLADACVQATFLNEEQGFVAVYLRYQADTPALKELRTTLAAYSLLLGAGYGVHCAGGSAAIYGDMHPSAVSPGTTKASYAKRPLPLKVQSWPAAPGPHTVSLVAHGDHLEISLDGKTITSYRKLRPEGSAAIIVGGNAKLDSPIVRQVTP